MVCSALRMCTQEEAGLGEKTTGEEMQRLSSSELFTAPTKEHGVLTTWNLGSEPGQGWRLSQCWGI